MTTPQTAAGVLDEALGHQAPHLVKQLELILRIAHTMVDQRWLTDADRADLADAVSGDILARLSMAIDRRVYIAKKDHDDAIAEAFDEASGRIRARYEAEREALAHRAADERCEGNEDQEPELGWLDTGSGPGALSPAAAADPDLTASLT